MILYMIQKAKKIIPSNCRIGDTFSTHMAVIGNLSTNDDLVSKHIDKDNFSLCYFILVNHCMVAELTIILV